MATLDDSAGSHHPSVWRPIALALALAGLTLAAYLPALRAQFVWDDNDYVTANTNLRDAAGLGRIWTDVQSNWQYYPLVFTTFWAEYHAWGLNPAGYHLDNILLHAAAAIVLWRLLLCLGLPAPWLAATIFAVHPAEVESVAWVTERKNVLCGVFYLSAMLVYFGGYERGKRGERAYWLALGLFACAMFSKTVAATWPVAVLIILWWKNGRLRRKDVWPLLPFVLIGLVLGLLTAMLERNQVGAGGKDWDLTVADRCIIAGRAVWFYALKAIVPLRLAFIYPKWDLNTGRAMQAIIAASAAVVLIVLLILHRRIGRGAGAAVLLFVVTLLPALGFVNTYPMRYSFVADHFQYLAIIALIVPVAVVLHRCCGRGALLLILPLMALTWRQAEIYRNPVTLWTDTVAKNGGSWMAHANLGQAWQAEGRMDLAEREYRLAAADAPDEVEVWWKLGAFIADQGRLTEAEPLFRHALEIDPTYKPARQDLAKLLNELPQQHK
jgi:tetratricopeptide (TPR) repeat protein